MSSIKTVSFKTNDADNFPCGIGNVCHSYTKGQKNVKKISTFVAFGLPQVQIDFDNGDTKEIIGISFTVFYKEISE